MRPEPAPSLSHALASKLPLLLVTSEPPPAATGSLRKVKNGSLHLDKAGDEMPVLMIFILDCLRVQHTRQKR